MAAHDGMPRKTRELHNHHFDSTVWNDFRFRGDDSVIAAYAKSGTTWTQHIVGQLIFAGDPDVKIAQISPWLDLRIMPPNLLELMEALMGRKPELRFRFIQENAARLDEEAIDA